MEYICPGKNIGNVSKYISFILSYQGKEVTFQNTRNFALQHCVIMAPPLPELKKLLVNISAAHPDGI